MLVICISRGAIRTVHGFSTVTGRDIYRGFDSRPAAFALAWRGSYLFHLFHLFQISTFPAFCFVMLWFDTTACRKVHVHCMLAWNQPMIRRPRVRFALLCFSFPFPQPDVGVRMHSSLHQPSSHPQSNFHLFSCSFSPLSPLPSPIQRDGEIVFSQISISKPPQRLQHPNQERPQIHPSIYHVMGKHAAVG